MVQIRNNIIKAITQAAENYEDIRNNDIDCGGIGDNFSMGYSCHLSKHKDGSGVGVDMTGCYVGLEVAKAVVEVLSNKLILVDDSLRELGVDV